jgi:ribosomal protein S18 acetylase RimI-like enzyme
MGLEIRDLAAEDLPAAGGVAGRALADSPTLRWALGPDPLARVGGSLDVFVGFVAAMPPPQLGAFLGNHVVGVAAAAAPGTCIGAIATDEMRTPPQVIGPHGDESRNLLVWSLFCGHDLEERHWHVGPVSVEPGLQGAGIGGQLLTALCDRMDADGEVAWLETDKPENVVFYRRHGFEVVQEVLAPDPAVYQASGDQASGDPASGDGPFTTWFMRRDPR